MPHFPAKSRVAIVVDPDVLRRRQLAAALAPIQVIDLTSLREAFALLEDGPQSCIAISETAAADPGFAMFLRLINEIDAQWVIYGRTPPPNVPPDVPWVAIGADGDIAPVAAVMAGRRAPGTHRAAAGRTPDLILIGASTGGIAAIETVLSQFSAECPPTLIVQHLRPAFFDGLLDRLNRCCRPHVVAAGDNTLPVRGTVYIAATPDHHLVLSGTSRPRMRIIPAPPDCQHRPSVDALFRSAAPLGPRIAAALLTGMGADGAQGLADIRAAGGFTVAQNRETSTVYGMPGTAAKLGAAMAILPLDQIGPALLSALPRPGLPHRTYRVSR